MAKFSFDASEVIPQAFTGLPDLPAIAHLQSLRQWVAWKIEMRDGKPTKPPVNPHNGFMASHSNPNSWGSYQEAVNRAVRYRLPGVGFVLTETDDLTGCDLDKCVDAETGEVEIWAREIVALAETYAEISPSGRGLRLIWKGKVEKTTKCDPVHVEIYRSQRYLTITGNHIAGTPTDIREAPKTLATLIERVDKWRERNEPKETIASRAVAAIQKPASPEKGESPFFRNVNTAALANLHCWVGDIFGSHARPQAGTGAYRVSSKALGRDLQEDLSLAPSGIVDFGVADMGDSRQGKRTPIDIVMEYGNKDSAKEAGFWLAEKMGKPAEFFGWPGEARRAAHTEKGAEIVRRLIENSGGDIVDEETGEVISGKKKKTRIAPFPDEYTRVPGLLGLITDWIEATARRPNRALALGAALTVVGTALGRRASGPTLNGTHLYVLCLAPTGAGKDHPLQQARRLLSASKMGHHIGPDDFMSMPALVNFITRMPLALCPMDEFGAFLKRINGRRASGFEQGITKTLRTAWGTNYGQMSTPEWAGRAMQNIYAPAVSIYGVSTPMEFYTALEGADIVNGFLNRFLCFTIEERSKDCDPALPPANVPDLIKDRLESLYIAGNPVQAAQRNVSGHPISPMEIPWRNDEARAVWRQAQDEIQRLIDRKPEFEPFMGRTAEMAIRLATIRAGGENAMKPSICVDDIRWGCDVAMWSARAMIGGAGKYMAETEVQGDAKRILRIIEEQGGRATYRTIAQRLKHRMRTRDLADALKNLVESGSITNEEVKVAGGHPQRFYIFTGDE